MPSVCFDHHHYLEVISMAAYAGEKDRNENKEITTGVAGEN